MGKNLTVVKKVKIVGKIKFTQEEFPEKYQNFLGLWYYLYVHVHVW